MSNLKIPSSWDLPENQATLEEIYLNRRSFLEQIGEVTVGALVLSALPGFLASAQASEAGSQNSTGGGSKKEEVPPNFQNRITPENLVTRYNNFYEFSTNKASIWHLAKKLPLEKWTLKISGQVAKPRTLDLEKLLRGISLEQRVYRLRCVETWSAIIPWTGFPLRDLIRALDPLSTARYIKFQTFLDPNAAAGQKERFWEPWPYTEGLSMTEAMHPLAFLAVGIYGHPLPPQNGAPIRLVVPWKYGFKSIKSIASMEFVSEAPNTFWQTVAPLDYDFWSNVNPSVSYARWDQRYETPLGKNQKVNTLLYNGYAREVGDMY